jgi:Tfp pilus assembly protein PilF
VSHASSWADSRILLGQAALETRDYPQAVAYFHEALQVDTQNPLAQRGLQTALSQEALFDPMRDQSEMTTLAYHKPIPEMHLAQFSRQQLSNIASQTPDRLQQAGLLVLAQLQHGDNTAAVRTATYLPKQYQHPTAWNLLGLAQYHTGDTLKAKKAFNQALALNGSFHAARLNLATIFMHGGDFKNAEAQIKQVLVETHFQDREALLSMVALKNLAGDKAGAKAWSARIGESL